MSLRTPRKKERRGMTDMAWLETCGVHPWMKKKSFGLVLAHFCVGDDYQPFLAVARNISWPCLVWINFSIKYALCAQ